MSGEEIIGRGKQLAEWTAGSCIGLEAELIDGRIVFRLGGTAVRDSHLDTARHTHYITVAMVVRPAR